MGDVEGAIRDHLRLSRMRAQVEVARRGGFRVQVGIEAAPTQRGTCSQLNLRGINQTELLSISGGRRGLRGHKTIPLRDVRCATCSELFGAWRTEQINSRPEPRCILGKHVCLHRIACGQALASQSLAKSCYCRLAELSSGRAQ